MESIPFFRAYVDKTELDLITQALFHNGANMVNAFENEISKYFGTKYAISTNNGTSAMHLALCAMDIKRGDKIICSVNTFPNVAEVIRHFDAEPILVDINEDDFNMNINEFEKTLKIHKHKKLKAAFITHLAGQSANMGEIYRLAKEFDIKILDDASRAMGAIYKDKKIGSMKESFISCFQINPQAQDAISTAGFFTTNDDEIARRAKLLRNNAIVSDGFDGDGNLTYIYDVVDIGQKYDLNSINAAFAKAQFSKTKNFINRRKEIAEIYNRELKDCPHIKTPVGDKNHIYTQYIIKVDKNRDSFARDLREKGINTSLHYIPIHLLNYYKNKYNFRVNDFPIALKVYQQILSLPIYAALSNDEAYYICKKVKEIAHNRV